MHLNPSAERRLFQLVVYLAAIIPIAAGAAGVWQGSAMIHRHIAADPDLDSHFRYLSGLLLGMGGMFVFAGATISRRAGLFQALGLIVILGGLSRLFGALVLGPPGTAHVLAMVMELLVMPALLLWLRRLQRMGQEASKAEMTG